MMSELDLICCRQGQTLDASTLNSCKPDNKDYLVHQDGTLWQNIFISDQERPKKTPNKIKQQHSTQCFYLKIKTISLFCAQEIYISLLLSQEGELNIAAALINPSANVRSQVAKTGSNMFDFNSVTHHQSILTDAQFGAAKGSPRRDFSELCAGLEKVALGQKNCAMREISSFHSFPLPTSVSEV